MPFLVPAAAEFDFGGPRESFTPEEHEAEIVRRCRLEDAGYVLRHRGMIYFWSETKDANDEPDWHWVDQNGMYLTSAFTTFEDHVRAWDEVLAR